MTTTLTWEARRSRVLAAKFIAIAALTFAWVVALQVIFSALMYPAAEFEGSTAGVDGAFWLDLSQVFLRVAVVGALASLLGAALATIGRQTAAALGIGFFYLTVVEGLIRGFKPSWMGWLVGDNAVLLMIGEADAPLGHSQTAALFLLLAYAGLVIMGSFASFTRRDLA